MAGAWDAGSSMLYLRYMRSASGAPEVTATTGAHERSEKTNLRKQGGGETGTLAGSRPAGCRRVSVARLGDHDTTVWRPAHDDGPPHGRTDLHADTQ
jgi:hypothetical protein